jgi:hypothetical protein
MQHMKLVIGGRRGGVVEFIRAAVCSTFVYGRYLKNSSLWASYPR